MSCLLLGNGINNRLKIDGLSESEIKERFAYNLTLYSPIFDALFSVKISTVEATKIVGTAKNKNIEGLAGNVYEHIKKQKEDSWSDNDEMRLQDTISCLCILSIFYNEKGLIPSKPKLSELPHIEQYDKVLTLNYVEFWDINGSCVHLHGKIDMSKLKNVARPFIYSTARYHWPEYRNAVKELSADHNTIEFDPFYIVLSPDGISKESLICTRGFFPRNKWYPAKDLFPVSGRKLYEELEEVSELDVFGVSPYGEMALIDKINKMDFVRVFVYNLEASDETKKWDELLKCPHVLLDSTEI